METGLGGRLDATNVLKPEVCAITSISYDHTEILGETLSKIAEEKAGIIKPGVTVVCAPQPPEASAAIEAVCLNKNAPLLRVGKDIRWEPGEVTGSGQCLRVTGTRNNYDLRIPLLGEYQLENAAIAVGCLEVLAAAGFDVTTSTMNTGLLNVHWPGRLQILRHRPLLVVDGAHNADSVEKLGKALNRYFDFDRIFLIAGTSQEKDVSGIVRQLSAIAGNVIITRSTNPRAATTARLRAEFSQYGIEPLVTESVPSAVDLALSVVGERDLICATGSLFVVAEVLEYLQPR
jgi:dihydrofolate synthase / folylpolyglutamate synthase